jgi:uncharacterized protein involved in exopolysaccharide biosynthesis
MSPAERLRQNRLKDIKAEMEFLDKEILAKQEAQKKLRGVSADLEHRVDATPTRESDLVALTRDYETLQRSYTSLLTRSEEAKVAANLERRQIGEQFKVIDAARLPGQPFTPDRIQINAIGSAAGLALGLALIALVEYRDNSFRTDEDVVSVLSLPVFATVPAIYTASEKRAAFRLRLMVAGAGVVFVLFSAAFMVAWKAHLFDRFR